MHRIDDDTAIVVDGKNRFTEGDPEASEKATKLRADFLNDLQENIASFIENRGVALVKNDFTQLETAIGLVASDLGTTFTIDNNITSETNITGLIFASASVKFAKIKYFIIRKDAGEELLEEGTLKAFFKNSAWSLSFEKDFDDSGVTFTIDSTSGQIKYQSTNMAGGTYSGSLVYKIERYL